MTEFTAVAPGVSRRPWRHRKGAVAPAAGDYRALANRMLRGLMGHYVNSSLAAFPPLELTSGDDRWPLHAGFIGTFAGPDMVVTLHDGQVVCQTNCYFVEPVAQHSTYLAVAPDGAVRRGFPLQKGDVVELSDLFLVTVVDVAIEATPAAPPPREIAPPRKVTFGHVVLDCSPPERVALAPTPKLQKAAVRERAKHITLQLQRKPQAALPAAHALQAFEPVRLVTFTSPTIFVGSLPGCDLYAPDLRPIHATIAFDGTDYVLSDVGHGTRLFLRHPVQLVPGDQLVLGRTTLTVVPATDPAVAAAGLAIRHLRSSTRKKRQLTKHAPVHVALPPDKTLQVGRSPDCMISLSSYALKLLQFAVSHTQRRVYVMPLYGTLNQGLYHLLHRRAPRRVHFFGDSHAVSAPLQCRGYELTRGSVVRIGSSELEVVAVKEKADTTLSQGMQNRYWNERSELLRRLPWLLLRSAPQGDAEISYVAFHAKEVEFCAGDTIYKLGHDALNAYVVLTGSVVLHRPPPDTGRGQYLEHLEGGDWFGEVALLWPPLCDVPQYDTHATALTHTTCVVLPAREIYYMWANYRDLYQVPLVRGVVEMDVLRSLKTLKGLEQVCLTLLHRVGFKLRRMTFTAGTDMGEQGLGLYCLVDGGLVVSYGERKEILRERCTWLGELTSLDVAPEAVHVQDMVVCWALSMDDYKHTIDFTLRKPQRGDPRLQVGSQERGLSRVDVSQMTAKKEASAHAMTMPLLGAMAPFGKATWAEHLMGGSEVDEGSGEIKAVAVDSWRQKKRNAQLLQARLEYLRQTDSIEYALVLYVLSGPNRGDVHIVYNCAVVGSDRNVATIPLHDRTVTSEHALFYHRDGHYFVRDLGSDLGTYVRLTDNVSTPINVGDVLLAGETEFTVLGAPPDKPPPRPRRASCCLQ
ncbi:hypothetical protein ACHHYP_11137 [Achlya hypogyna]|uniref:Uncharacterized protein n=1 Tax=Achlya hypogyna TaxID=1202772 RepID=A0A1V9YJS4_ACHHY|nr:hypothetical protein ACHHYP_11137 [Achlya hypogyna]